MTTKQREAIEDHGRNLLAIFPNAAERDPVKLCKKLRRLEAKAAAIGLRLCNGPEYPTEDAADNDCEAVLLKVDALLDFDSAKVPIFVNLDPRGYALKIRNEWMETHNIPLHRDWGGYGIIAP